MQDVALPLMCDKRWEEDTLFLVFEEDFRFTNDDDSEPVFIKARQLQEVVGEEAPEEDLSGRKKVPIGFSNKVHGTSLVCVSFGCLATTIHNFQAVEPSATATNMFC